MPNYVNTIISVRSENPNIGPKLTEVFDKNLQESEAFYKAIFERDTFEDGQEVTTGYGQYAEDIGSKWCYMTDAVIYDNNAEITLDSAWCFPDGAFKQIYDLLAKIDPDVLISCTYTDEAYNFVGAAAYGPNGYTVEEEPELPDYPDMDEMSDDEFDQALEKWQEEVDEIIADLDRNCIQLVEKKPKKKSKKK